jgi:hypothetical protein
MNELADCSGLVLTHQRKVVAAADVLGEVRARLLAAAAEAMASQSTTSALCAQSSQARRRSDALLRDALRLTAAAERLITDARAILSECEPAATSQA